MGFDVHLQLQTNHWQARNRRPEFIASDTELSDSVGSPSDIGDQPRVGRRSRGLFDGAASVPVHEQGAYRVQEYDDGLYFQLDVPVCFYVFPTPNYYTCHHSQLVMTLL